MFISEYENYLILNVPIKKRLHLLISEMQT